MMYGTNIFYYFNPERSIVDEMKGWMARGLRGFNPIQRSQEALVLCGLSKLSIANNPNH